MYIRNCPELINWCQFLSFHIQYIIVPSFTVVLLAQNSVPYLKVFVRMSTGHCAVIVITDSDSDTPEGSSRTDGVFQLFVSIRTLHISTAPPAAC